MADRKPKVLKTTSRAAAGGVLAVAGLLALMFFRGFGLTGGGSGDATEDSSDGQMLTKLDSSAAAVSEPEDGTEESGAEKTEPSEDALRLTLDEQVAVGQKVLGILIDERDYLLQIPGASQDVFRPTNLERLVVLAEQVSGDSNGIKVRVLRRETARTTAEQELMQALSGVGISSSAVYMPDEFVP